MTHKVKELLMLMGCRRYSLSRTFPQVRFQNTSQL